MAGPGMILRSVRVRPEGKLAAGGTPSRSSGVEVPDGTLLSEAIALAGVGINLSCGGQGRCGRCRVIVEGGQVQRRSNSRLSTVELEQGYALACQTTVAGDVLVLVPAQEAIVRRLPSEKAAMDRPVLPVECDWRSSPIVRKFFLTIEPPSLADNTTDLERLQRELSKQHGIPEIAVSLPMLRKVARALRESQMEGGSRELHGTPSAPGGDPSSPLPRGAKTTGLPQGKGPTGQHRHRWLSAHAASSSHRSVNDLRVG